MSASRSQWDESEELLLKQVYNEAPRAKLHELWRVFHGRNHQDRTKHAVKAKLISLGLRVPRGHDDNMVSPQSEQQVSSPPEEQMFFPPEQQIFLPLKQQGPIPSQNSPFGIRFLPNPLITRAREHMACVQAAGFISNVAPVRGWAETLDDADISGLRCAESDKVALREYMDYIRGESWSW